MKQIVRGLRRWSVRRERDPFVLAVGLAFVVGTLVAAGVAADSRVASSCLLALAAALATAVLAAKTLGATNEQTAELRSLWALSGVMLQRRAWPVPGGWALGADALLFLEDEISRRGHGVIVELGPGVSSVVLGERFGDQVSLVGLEHDEFFSEALRRRLDERALRYQLIAAPLTVQPCGGETVEWYAPSSVAALPPTIDVLVVDGPPNWDSRHRRSPAWPALGDRLVGGALILVDDTDRRDERAMVMAWLADPRLALIHDGGSFMALRVLDGKSEARSAHE